MNAGNNYMEKYKGFLSEKEYLKVMEKAVETALVGITVYDKDGKFVFCNKILEILTGIPKEVMQLSTAKELGDKEKRGKSATIKVLESKDEVIFEQNMAHNGKSYLTKGIPYFNDDGEISYVISNVVDVNKFIVLKKNLEQDDKTQNKRISERHYSTESLNGKLLIYNSALMQKVMDKILMLEYSSATVLLQGESGTGKEVIAKIIHDISDRRENNYIKINCGAIPEALFESELFGYEPGSFTGGEAKGKVGLLEHANHGTVLLDEISEIPLKLQSKILRVLQEGEIQKIGKADPIRVDIRFIAATNVDLEELTREGKFRKDLYYRLNVIPINLPPLRDRREDIPSLALHFLHMMNGKYGFNKTISEDVIARIKKMDFPGNIRELENLVERLLLFSGTSKISIQDLNAVIASEVKSIDSDSAEIQLEMSFDEIMDAYEKKILEKYKEVYKTSRKIAEVLKIDQSTVSRKLKKYNIT